MDKILWLVIAATVVLFAGVSVAFMLTDSMTSVTSFTNQADDAECEAQADLWEEGDPIDSECIEYLDEENQDDAVASTVESDIT